MLSRAGLPGRASEYLNVLVEEGLSESEESRLRGLIAEAQGADPVEARKEQFKNTNSLNDLRSLTDELETRGDWDDLCEYGEILFERTRSLHEAERLARALAATQKNERIVEFMRANQELLSQSKNLHMLYCWSLYREGALLEARSELAKLSDDRDDPNYRALQVNLGIAMGDWNSLSAIVANEYEKKDERNAEELMGAAQLALHLGLPNAKELVFAAARKSGGDADILAAAYFSALSAGWEDDAEVSQWLHDAASLSGDDGPIKKVSIKDVLDLQPEWDRRESETWRLLSCGDIPMFIAAESLNRSLIDLMLFPALANLSENDLRRRNAIPAYSGKRQSILFDAGGVVGMDATALLTLSFLNVLNEAFDAFDTVYLPHSTLAWLSEEKQKVAFHQPSRIRNARQVRHLLATDKLEKLVPSTMPDSDLCAQVGEDLALLVAEAEGSKDEDEFQRIVVRSSPVHRVASLMEEEADLTAHAAVLSGCQAVVDKLRQKGQITSEEEKKARAYLQLQEKPWPNQPEISDGAILYLDELAITYFLHLGLLGKLQGAGFKPIASPRMITEANALISNESISAKVSDAIENIRSAVNSRIESGRIKVGRQAKGVESEGLSISEHPSFATGALAKHCNALIIDDRFINQHANIDDPSGLAQILSTLDLLDALVAAGSITAESRSEYATLLRRAGYFFVPVSDDELARHLDASIVIDDKVIETAELKAIRENILRVRMSSWLQFPKEAPWLNTLLATFIGVLKGQWKADADFPNVRARSDWILDQIDVRGWAHILDDETGDNLVKIGRGADIMFLLSSPVGASPEVREEYWSWIEDRVLAPIKEQYAELYSWIVGCWRKRIVDIMEGNLAEEDRNEPPPDDREVLVRVALELTPPLIREALFENADFREEYGLTADAVLSFGDSGFSVQRSDLLNAIRTLFSGKAETKVTDSEGREWKLENVSGEGGLPELVLSRDKQRLILPDSCPLSPDRTTRLHSLDKAASDFNLPSSARERWRNVLKERALEDDEIDAYHREFRDTLIQMAQSIHSEIAGGESSISSLVPPSRKYFERLVGAYDGSATIREYAANRARTVFDELSAWRPYQGFLFSLFLSSHSLLTAEINVDQLSSEDFLRALDFLEKNGDRVSQLGAIEVGLRVLPSRPEIETILVRLIEQIRDDDATSQSSGFKLLSALFVLVDGELSRTRLLSAEPPFYRRLAALSHAALIQQQIVNSSVDIDRFCEWAYHNCAGRFFLQSLTDMRTEPRWSHDLIGPSQMKAEFFGRIMIAAKDYEQNIKSGELFDLVLGTESGSIHSHSDLVHSYLPGPLEGGEKIEGGEKTQNILPPEITEAIKTQLGAEEVGATSFIALVNSALIFRNVPADQAELAAKALKIGSYRLANIEDRSQLLAVLSGLATVAAVARSCSLADELRILVRRYRHDAEYVLSIEEAMTICLVASASRVELKDWREFAGDWLTELAFSDLGDDQAKMLHSHLQYLCHVVPELWISCGRAEAALTAYNASRVSV